MLHDIRPELPIIESVRYASNENFVGTVIKGYEQSPNVKCTLSAGRALKEVQSYLDHEKLGYSLVVYDGYRPQKAVDHFWDWSQSLGDTAKQDQYYPRLDKAHLFTLGYLAKRSGHTLGNTFDLTLIEVGKKVTEIQEIPRVLQSGVKTTYLDDGTLDMGTHFDFLDEASHHGSQAVSPDQRAHREMLRKIMEKHSFKAYNKEWWHYQYIAQEK